MSPLLKNLFIVLIVVVIAGGAYFVLKSDGSTEGGALSLAESDAVKQIAKTLSDTKKIDTFKLEGGVFGDAKFASLKKIDIDAELAETETGRSNPFEKVQ